MLITASAISIIYLITVTFLMNSSLVIATVLGDFGLEYKLKILTSLLLSMWSSMTVTGFVLLILTAILTGLNISLLAKKLKDLKKQGSLELAVGGSTIIAIVSSGCASCGLPVMALLGLSGSVAYLPFRGMELSYLSVILLSWSLYLLVRQNKIDTCNI